MLDYIKKSKLEIMILSIYLVFLNTYKIFFHVIGVDTEQALIALNPSLNWTLGSGRFVSAIFRKILMPYGFNYDIAMLITIVMEVLTGVLYQYCLTKFGRFNRWCCILFSMIFVSCPIWAEQTYFVCSFFVNAIGILFCVIAAYLIIENIYIDGDKKWLGVAVLLIMLAIGIYQALLYLVIANCIVFLTLNAYTQKIIFKDYLKEGIKCIGLIIIAMAVYLVSAKIMTDLFYDPTIDYVGYGNAALYIANRVKWLEEDVFLCWSNIYGYFLDSINPQCTYGTPILMISWCILQVIAGIKIIVKKEYEYVVVVIGNILLIIAVYLGCFLLGGTITVREQMVIPLAVAFWCTFIVDYILKYLRKKLKTYTCKMAETVMAAICIYVVILMGNKQMLINMTDYERYISDVAFANKVMDTVGSAYDYSSQKIVFLGKNNWSLPDYYYKGEMIGYSVFSWDYYGPVGVNYRAYGFLQSQGYEYMKPSIEDVQIVNSMNAAEDIFEENRVILVDDYIVVDLNKF